MACPYFIPTEVIAGAHWPHRARLPLGEGWAGKCCAQVADFKPAENELRDFCNLGYPRSYSRKCPHCPENHEFDAVRVAVVAQNGPVIVIDFACERNFEPVQHGFLHYDRVSGQWIEPHEDIRIQAKADAYIRTWLERNPERKRAAAQPLLSPELRDSGVRQCSNHSGNDTTMDRIASLLEILNTNPDDTFARYALGMEYSRDGRTDDAVDEFRTLISKQPDYANAYFMAAQTLANAQRTDEARTMLTEGIAAAHRSRNQHAASEMEEMLEDLNR